MDRNKQASERTNIKNPKVKRVSILFVCLPRCCLSPTTSRHHDQEITPRAPPAKVLLTPQPIPPLIKMNRLRAKGTTPSLAHMGLKEGRTMKKEENKFWPCF